MAPKTREASVPTTFARRTTLAPASAVLLSAQDGTYEQAEIVRKTRTDFVRERAYVAKAQVGIGLVQHLAAAVEQNYVEFVEGEQALLRRVPETTRAQTAEFFAYVRTDHANDLLDLQHIAAERVKEVVGDPVDPPLEREHIIEEKLPPFGGFFGGTKVTRVTR